MAADCDYLCGMTKQNYDIVHMKRRDIMSAYRKVAPKCWSQSEAWQKTADSPAPRYYISGRQAWLILRSMVAGDFSVVDNMNPQSRERYYSLFHKLQELMQKREFIGKSLFYICKFLVLQPAPKFFVTPRAVEHIFSSCKKYGTEYRDTQISEDARNKKAHED